MITEELSAFPGGSLSIYSSGGLYAAQQKRVNAFQIIKELEEISGTSLTQATRETGEL